jgi:protein FRA10AC1
MDGQERLVTLELPFSYVEHGEDKFALVKVVLCGKCCKKLMWKRTKEKEISAKEKGKQKESPEEGVDSAAGDGSNRERRGMRHHGERKPATDDIVGHRRRRSSRSLSPRERIGLDL